MSVIVTHETKARRALDSLANTDDASGLHLGSAAVPFEQRSGLQRLMSAIAAGPATFMRRLSCGELFASRDNSNTPELKPNPEEKEEERKKREKRPSFSEILLYPIELTIEMLSTVRRALGTTTSVVHIERPEAAARLAVAPADSPSAPAAFHRALTVTDLSPPKDTGSEMLAMALERVASEVRKERQEKRDDSHKEEEERQRQITKARDTIHAIDMLNGIRNPMAEDIIRQMEGPYGISVETAMARMEELNRQEKK